MLEKCLKWYEHQSEATAEKGYTNQKPLSITFPSIDTVMVHVCASTWSMFLSLSFHFTNMKFSRWGWSQLFRMCEGLL